MGRLGLNSITINFGVYSVWDSAIIKEQSSINRNYMQINKICFTLAVVFSVHIKITAQKNNQNSTTQNNNARWFSLGGRSTISTFSDEGFGLGTGGQFRLQLSNKVNTDWFADYISINNDNIRNEYFHIGWSVLFYPIEKLQYPDHKLQPFILAGHCFDYNQKTLLKNPSVKKDRWGSAVQGGIGFHFNISKRSDITLMSQYMIHLTKELEVTETNGNYSIENSASNILQGHLLSTISLNYKVFKLWVK